MTFRARLTLFFVLIVLVPMLVVGVVLVRVVTGSERGRAETRLSESVNGARSLVEGFGERSANAARRMGRDPALGLAVQRRDAVAARTRLRELARLLRARAVVLEADGAPLARIGPAEALGVGAAQLRAADGEPVGLLRVSVLSLGEYVRFARGRPQRHIVVRQSERVLFSTLSAGAPAPPRRGEATIGGRDHLTRSFAAPGLRGRPLTVTLAAGQHEWQQETSARLALLGGLVSGFLLLAFWFAMLVSRALQGQVQRLLEAARRIGRGDFQVAIPTEGGDEFAALGREFREMAAQLEARLRELERERSRLREAIRRTGETLGSALDRDALLALAVQTAIDGVGATGGRALARELPDAALEERARQGDVDGLLPALERVEAEALRRRTPVESAEAGGAALAQVLAAPAGNGGHVFGVLSVARPGEPFTAADRELFGFLAAQAVISLENVDLHEAVRRQAVTDELTGLRNHRRFQEVLSAELERSRRFGQPLGLILLDIDNFKSINDTYGHLQGDRVLREVARVLRESSREIDEPARYGGEEMAVALPQTDLEGAYRFAERVRQEIEALEIPLVDGSGTIRVTASFGVTALPAPGVETKDDLVGTADAALYEAKRAGRNKTLRARVR